MEKQNSTRLVQDLSSLIASILPILQLFFTQLPPSITGFFLAQKQFVGVSLVTLLLSYVMIIAFQSKPWFEFALPFQRKKEKNFQAYQNRLFQASSALEASLSKPDDSKKLMQEYIDALNEKPVDPPIKLKRDNLVSVGLFIVAVSAVIFVVFAFLPYSKWAAIIQAIGYVLLIVFSVLILSVYRSTVTNNARYEEEGNTKVSRAIELAKNHNVFGNLPSVRIVETFDAPGYPSNLNIVAEHNGDYYHVITDPAAKRLIRGRKLDSYNENS
jgi:hypothetical protein